MGGFASPIAGGQLNVAASNIARQYRNNAMIADMLAPRVQMARQTFQYVVHDKSAFRLDASSLRAPGARPQSIRSSFSTAPYFCKSHAFEAEIPVELEQYGLGFGFSQIQKATMQAMQKLSLDREVALAAIVTNPANIPNTLALAGASMWDSYKTGGVSTPIENVDEGRALIRQSGVDANLLILSDPTFVALKSNPDVIERFKYTRPGAITLDDLSTVFGVKTVVASAVLLDENDNQSFVWGQNAILAYSQQVADQEDLSALKTFTWDAAPETVSGYGVIVEPKYPLSTKTTLVSTDWYYDMRVTGADTIFTFTNTCAAPVNAAYPAPVANY